MRIIFITSKLNFETSGGSVAELDLKVKTLKKLGHTVAVITAFSSWNKINEPLPYKVIEENIFSGRLLPIQSGVFKILRKYSPQADFFHIDGHLFLYGAGLYKILGGRVPVVAHFNRELICWPDNVSSFLTKEEYKLNSFLVIKREIRWLVERYLGMFLANHIDLFSFANPVLKKVYEEFGLRKESSFTIGDLVDHVQIRAEAGVTEGYFVKNEKTNRIINIFYTGRMVPGKGFDTLLLAFSKIKNKQNLRLILGGNGPEEKDVRQLACELGISQYIKFLGWISKKEVYDYFRQTDIFVLPKCMRLEFNSIALLEAMVFGLPCVVPAGGALAWSAGKSALTYEDENPSDLAEKIEQLAVSPELRKDLSHNCTLRLKDEELIYTKQVQKLNEYLLELSAKSQNNTKGR